MAQLNVSTHAWRTCGWLSIGQLLRLRNVICHDRCWLRKSQTTSLVLYSVECHPRTVQPGL